MFSGLFCRQQFIAMCSDGENVEMKMDFSREWDGISPDLLHCWRSSYSENISPQRATMFQIFHVFVVFHFILCIV